MNILLHDELNVALVTVKKRKQDLYTVYIGESPCLLQAIGSLLYNPNVYMNGYVSLLIESDSCKTVNKLCSHVSRLCHSGTTDISTLKMYNYNKDSVGCFDYDDMQFDIHRLSRGDKLVFIFQPERFEKKGCQLNPILKLWQIKKLACTSVPTKPFFIQETKYERMIRMGVPEAAVKQKMIMDGILPGPSTFTIPPPPPPPPPLAFKSSPSLAMALIDIKSGNFTLKKAQKHTLLENNVSIIKRLSSSAKHEPPTLEEILKAKSQLRKIM